MLVLHRVRSLSDGPARAALLVVAAIAGSCRADVSVHDPVRLVAGIADTLVINNTGPAQLTVRAVDAEGRTVSDSGVRYEWLSGTPISVTATGVVTCTEPGDAAVRASLGALATRLILRCRPVHEVRSLRMMNLVIGEPAQDFSFAALDRDGRPVTMLSGSATIFDSSIATVQGARVAGRRQGTTAIDMRIGDHVAHASVHVYQMMDTLDPRVLDTIRPGQHVAMPVRLRRGETRRWRLPGAPELYFVTLIPDATPGPLPRVVVTGAACTRGFDAQSFFCLAKRGATVVVYHTPLTVPTEESSGFLAVWRQEKP